METERFFADLAGRLADARQADQRTYERFFYELALGWMSPTGEGPSEWSIDRKALDEKWQCRFAITSYHEGQEERSDEFHAYRVPISLANWLGECRKICKVERVRWFLHDAEMFCQRTFGDWTMTTDSEARAVQDFLLSNPDHLTVARAVYESWPEIKNHVCRRFPERLRCRIKRKIKAGGNLHHSIGDMHVGFQYVGEKANENQIWLYRTCWIEYEEVDYKIGRTAILLEADGKGPSGWYIGVLIPKSIKKMINGEKGRRKSLIGNLNPIVA